MVSLWQDIRYGFRMLVRNPGFTFVVVLILALGIGANTAIFSVVNGVLLRPLPYGNPDRLVMVWGASPQKGWYHNPVSFPNFTDWRDQNRVFEDIAACRPNPFSFTGGGGVQQIAGEEVSCSLFQVLGVQAALGRTFLPEEEDPHIVILSHGFWQRSFGSDPNIVGQSITLNGSPFTVIGIMPPDFWFPVFWSIKADQLWVPLDLEPNERGRGNNCLVLVGRLKSDVTLRQAQTEMNTIARRLEQEYPNTNTGWTANLVRAHQQVVGNIRPALLVLLGAVGLVLLITCANVANLLLARAEARQKEVAIRRAVGASRLRLVRQLLTENVLLSALGGTLGALLAVWSIEPMLALIPGTVPRLDEIAIDLFVFGFTVTTSLLTGLLFGVAPALQVSGINVNQFLKEGTMTSTEGVQRHRLRRVLVISEVAVSLTLLIGAGLMVKSFLRLRSVDPGFNPQNLLIARVSLPRPNLQQFIERIEALPDVRSVGAVNRLPVYKGSQTLSFTIEGRPSAAPGQDPSANFHVASCNYFHTMSIPVLMGRRFTQRDIEETPPVVVVNQTFARRHFPEDEPIGKRLSIGGTSHEIVGVIGDVKHGGLAGQVDPEIYWPFLQKSGGDMFVVVRTVSDPVKLASVLRNEIKKLRGKPIPYITTMERMLAATTLEPRFNMLLLGIFASAAVLLAAMGIYGVMSYAVTQRTHEIGIRMALGAQTRDVLQMVVKQGLSLALIGVAVGLGAALALSRVISSLLYEVSPTDPLTFVCVSLFFTGVALLASYIPARRAARIDPMVALRYE